MLRLSNACHLQTVWQTLPSTKVPPTTCSHSEESVKIEPSSDDRPKQLIPDFEIIPNDPSSISKEFCSPSDSASINEEAVTNQETQPEFEKETPAALIIVDPPTRSETSTSIIEKAQENVEETIETITPFMEDEEEEEPSLPLPPPSFTPPCSSISPSTASINSTPPPSIPSMHSMAPAKSRRRYHFLGSKSPTPEVSPSPSQLTDPPLSKMSKRKTLSKKLKKVFTKKG